MRTTTRTWVRTALSAQRSEGGGHVLRPRDHVCEGEAIEVAAHVRSDVGPHREERALALVVARPVLVRKTEIAEGDRSVDRGDDRAEGDLLRWSCEDVSATDAALGLHEARTFERKEDLLEVGLGEPRTFRDVADRSRNAVVAAKREGQEGSRCVVTACGHPHDLYRTANTSLAVCSNQ